MAAPGSCALMGTRGIVDQVSVSHDVVGYRQPVGYEHRGRIDLARGVCCLQLEPRRPRNIVVRHEVFSILIGVGMVSNSHITLSGSEVGAVELHILVHSS